MPRKKFKCSKCDRSFSMGAHLGRHMTTIHASPKQKAAQKAKARKATSGPHKNKMGRPSGVVSRLGLRDMSLEQLSQVIDAARDQAWTKLAELQGVFG